MDNIAQEGLYAWLSEQGFSGSAESLGEKLCALDAESRFRLCWIIWRGKFHAGKRVLEVLQSLQELGEKHFEYHNLSADYLNLGSMDFSKRRASYAHRRFKSMMVRLEWEKQFSYDTVVIRVMFRYGENDEMRDRDLTFKLK